MEVPLHWRLKKIRYELGVEVDQDGQVVGNVPTGIRDHVEAKMKEEMMFRQLSAEALTLRVLAQPQELEAVR